MSVNNDDILNDLLNNLKVCSYMYSVNSKSTLTQYQSIIITWPDQHPLFLLYSIVYLVLFTNCVFGIVHYRTFSST